MALVQRFIDVKFQLGQSPDGTPQKFGDGSSDTVTLTGLRVSARVNKAGTPAGATANLQIFGMKLSTMNRLATLGMVYSQIRRNTVTIIAGEGRNVPATVFIGTILQAWTDFSNMPEVAFHVEAQTLGAESVIPADPTSIQGSADVAQLMKGFAKQMGCTFENNGIAAKIPYPYFYGSPASQAAACATAAGINWFVDNKVLAIWPRGKSRAGVVPLISSETGLIGYPGFTAYGLMLRTIFNPDLRFGGNIKVKSSLEPANADGVWTVYSLDHEIDAMVPNGRWFTSIVCYNPNFPRQVAT